MVDEPEPLSLVGPVAAATATPPPPPTSGEKWNWRRPGGRTDPDMYC